MRKITTYLKVSLIKGDVGKTGGFGASAFTLVELIVVITILAILGTIAFLSLQGYSQNARDGVRISDIKNIEKGLGVMLVKSGIIPTPDDTKINITASGTVIGIQGYAGKLVQSQIGMSKESGKDPLDGTYYTYYTNTSKIDYQIMGFLEGGLSKNTLLGNSYAANYSSRTILTKGSELGILVGNSGSTLNQPAQEIITTSIDLAKTTTNSGYTIQFTNTDTSKILLGSSYTGSMYGVVYNKRNDLLINKTLASADDSLVGYWDMESTVMSGSTLMLKDLSKYGNHGTCYNSGTLVNCGTSGLGPQFVSGNGTTGKAMNFDGVDDWIELPNSSTLNINGDKISIVLKVTPIIQGTGTFEILGRHTSATDSQATIVLTNSLLTSYYSVYSSTGSMIWAPSQLQTPLISQNISKIFSYVYNGSKARLYNISDNVSQDTYFSGNAVNQTSKTTIGKYLFPGNWEVYKGTIDEVRIYNRALSDSEITALYNSTK